MGFSDGTMRLVNQDEPSNGYFFAIGREGNARHQIKKAVSNTYTELTYVSGSLSASTYYRAAFAWKDTALKAFLNGSNILNATDSSFSSQSYIFVSNDYHD